MIHPKICPEPSLRKRYRHFKQYSVYHGERDYRFTVNGSGILIICNSKFKYFKGKPIRFFKQYCKEKGKELKLLADEEKEIWYL